MTKRNNNKTTKACDPTVKTVERMLAVGTPLIVVDTHDHPNTLSRLQAAIVKQETRPLVLWNLADGFVAGNQLGENVLSSLEKTERSMAASGPHAALSVGRKFPAGTVIIIDNLHWFFDKPPVMQALLNVREIFKSSNRAVIGLTLQATIPADLVQNVSYVEDPLPEEAQLAEAANDIYKAAYGKEMEDGGKQLAQELRGNSPYLAEQLVAQSLTKEGVNSDRLRENARKQINDTPGLSCETGSESFDDIGGLEAITEYLKRYFDGPRRPSVVVRIEEIEKAMAGAGTDSSGTSGDALGAMLTAMEDNRWTGILAYGVSGCGKSLVAKAAANQFGAKAIRFDINACKDSLVGQSEKRIRQAMDILKAIGGERVFFIASMNQINSLPPELRRRFAGGTWYFDVPDKAGREDIWRISAQQFDVEWDGYDAEMLTGADIRDIVQRSYELGCTTTEAARYHVPLCKAAPDAIAESRSDASGRYLDANHGGPYRDDAQADVKYERSINLGD